MKISVGVAVALLLGAMLWPTSAAYQFVARATISLVALTAALQAGHQSRNVWVFGLAAVAVLVNPALPILPPSTLTFWVMVASLVALATWVVMLERNAPVPSVAEILHPLDGVK
jgi:hypothetical protein